MSHCVCLCLPSKSSEHPARQFQQLKNIFAIDNSIWSFSFLRATLFNCSSQLTQQLYLTTIYLSICLSMPKTCLFERSSLCLVHQASVDIMCVWSLFSSFSLSSWLSIVQCACLWTVAAGLLILLLYFGQQHIQTLSDQHGTDYAVHIAQTGRTKQSMRSIYSG